MGNIEQQICDAVQIIVDKAISSAGYDKTIKATVEECLDAATGKYKLEYQDTHIIAYSPDIQYSEGTLVNVTIPNNDMTALKTILSAASYDTVLYSSILNLEDKYKVIGQSVVIGSPTIKLNGYENKNITLYQHNETNNIISLTDIKELQEYMREADSFSISAEIQTTLPLELQKNGDYGIVAVLSFTKEDNISEHINIPYVFNTTYINGNPYLLVDFVKQNAFFNIDGSKFHHIERIIAFTTNFPNTETKSSNPNIFLKNFEIKALQEYDEADLEGGLVKLVSRTGLTFSDRDADSDFKEIEAHMLMDLKETTTNLRFFWFKENGAITSADKERYNAYGGSGWECLNGKNRFNQEDGAFIEEGETLPASYIVEWIPFTGNTLTVRKGSITTRKQAFKCVIICDEVPYEEEIVITNFDSPYYVEIESDSGVKFFNGYGSPTLECILYHNDAKVTNLTNFEFIWTDSDMNDSSFVINGDNLGDAKFNVVPGAKNKIKAHIAAISNYHTYRCSVVETVNGERISRGENSIQILNSESDNATYSLYIKNGQQVFKYNNDNIAPTSNSLENPMKLKPLTFSFFDPEGREVPAADIIKMGGKITWKVPTDTMLIISSYITPDFVMSNEEYSCYTNVGTLPYEISPTYQVKNYRNNITLEVEYQGVLLSATTEFSFFKDGDIGTNGTEFVCRLLPNKDTDEYPTLRVNQTGTILGGNFKNGTVTNYDSSSMNVSTSWFKAELWQGYKKVGTWYMNQNDGAEWYMMNKKDGEVRGFSDYEVKNSSYLQYSKTTELATNILKVEVEHQGKKYTAVSPILTATVADSSYDIKLKSGTGFLTAMYMEDGTYPSYNDSYPFEIEVTKNGTKLDINSSSYTVTWDIINGGERFLETEGRYRYLDSDTFLYKVDEVDTTILAKYRTMMSATPEKSKELVAKTNFYGVALPSRRKIAPKAEFSSESTSNAIKVTVYQGSTEIASLHIPIYLYLNSFGKSAIDGWDGNSVTIGDDYFLAPQVGAGVKDEYNKYTGLLMGEVKYADVRKSPDIGLVGYNKNTRTIFLDAQTGSAEFGHGRTSIKISPGGEDGANAILSGGGFSEGTDGRGLEIDLSAPTIKYGNGKFSVDKYGIMRATGAYFTDGTLSIGRKNSKPVFSVTSDGVMTMTQGSISLGGTAAKPVFSVTDEGILTMTRGSISLGTNSNSATGYNFDVQNDGTLTLTKGSISLGYNSSAKNYNFTVNNDGELTIKKSINLGDGAFIVDGSGALSMSKGSINLGNGVFVVDSDGTLSMRRGSISLGAFTDDKGKTDYKFKVNNDGTGNFGVWNFTGTAMSANLTNGGTFILNKYGIYLTDGTNTIFSANREGGVLGYWNFSSTGIENTEKDVYLTSSGLKAGKYFKVTKDGGFTFGNSSTGNCISFDGTHLTLGEGVTLRWDNIEDKDIPDLGTALTNIGPTWLATQSIAADQITAGVLNGHEITGGTITIGSNADGHSCFHVKDSGAVTARKATFYGDDSNVKITLKDKVYISAHYDNQTQDDYIYIEACKLGFHYGLGEEHYYGQLYFDDEGFSFTKKLTISKSLYLNSSLYFTKDSAETGLYIQSAIYDEDQWKSAYMLAGQGATNMNNSDGYIRVGSGFLILRLFGSKVYFGTTDTLVTSDGRAKRKIGQNFSKYENFFYKIKPFHYNYNTDLNPNNRHLGFIAQNVKEALISSGLTEEEFAGLSKITVETPEDEATFGLSKGKEAYALNYNDFIPLNTHMIQKCMKRIKELENKLKEAGIE